MSRYDRAPDDVAPIIVADGGIRCEHCGECFDADDVPTTTIPSTTLYRCQRASGGLRRRRVSLSRSRKGAFVSRAIEATRHGERTMATNTPNNGETRDEPDDYHPSRHVSPEAVDRAMSMLDSDEMETMNRTTSGNSDLADDDRVLVEVSQQSAEYVRRHAWSLDRDPGEILDEMIWYANIHEEEAIDGYTE